MGKRPEWEVLGCRAVMKESGSPIAAFGRPEDAELAVACVNACKNVNPTMVRVAFGALKAINASALASLESPSDTKNVELMGALFAMLPKLLKQLQLPEPEPEKPKVEQPTTRFGSLN